MSGDTCSSCKSAPGTWRWRLYIVRGVDGLSLCDKCFETHEEWLQRMARNMVEDRAYHALLSTGYDVPILVPEPDLPPA